MRQDVAAAQIASWCGIADLPWPFREKPHVGSGVAACRIADILPRRQRGKDDVKYPSPVRSRSRPWRYLAAASQDRQVGRGRAAAITSPTQQDCIHTAILATRVFYNDICGCQPTGDLALISSHAGVCACAFWLRKAPGAAIALLSLAIWSGLVPISPTSACALLGFLRRFRREPFHCVHAVTEILSFCGVTKIFRIDNKQ